VAEGGLGGGSGTQRDKEKGSEMGGAGKDERVMMVGPVVYSVASNFRFFLQLCGTSLLAAVVAGHILYSL